MKLSHTLQEPPDSANSFISSLVAAPGGGSLTAIAPLLDIDSPLRLATPIESLEALLALKHRSRHLLARQVAAVLLRDGDVPVASAPVPGADRIYLHAKRCVDVALSAAALLVLLPLFVVIAFLIVICDGGPVLYHQPRIGLDGRVFRFYKFRSMCHGADGMKADLQEHNEADGGIFKMRNDPRVTPLGRFLRRYSLDELPQLLSVLRGDMSLIGPRPMVVDEASMCDARQWQRHAVRPGLLCLREVCGRSGLSFQEWVELDLLYVACQSLRADFRILAASLPAIVSSEHAY